MPEFLILKTPAEALAAWCEHFPDVPLPDESIDSSRGLNRVLARTVFSQKPVPSFPRSTMDGYAIRAKDSFGASESLPAYFTIIGEIPMGENANISVDVGQAALIHTGGMMPDGADAVVMLEHTQNYNRNELEVTSSVAAAENVIQIGEDIPEGQMVLPAGTILQPADIGGLMALGQTRVRVYKKPRIGVLSSGDEIIDPGLEPLGGQVRDINAYSISANIEKWGGEALRLGIIPDDEDELQQAMSSALKECDAVIVSAGSSASVRDHTANIIAHSGAPGVIVHGINIKPGKPTILAVCDGKPVVGLPGNPVSALVIARFFVKPMIEKMLKAQTSALQPTISARLSVNLSSQAGREDWWPVKVIQTEGGVAAEPVFYKSNLIFTYMQAQGLIKIPADANGLAANSVVEVYPL